MKKPILFVIIILFSLNNAFSQQEEEYVYNWYSSNLNYLDKEKERACGNDDYLKKVYFVQNLINIKSFRDINGSTDRKSLLFNLTSKLLILNMNNCIIIEEFTTFHALKYNVYVIDYSGNKFKLKKEKDEWIIVSKEDIDFLKFSEGFNNIDPKLVCDDILLENYYLIINKVENGVFKSKILPTPCSSLNIGMTWK